MLSRPLRNINSWFFIAASIQNIIKMAAKAGQKAGEISQKTKLDNPLVFIS
jgi:hypothetical protein